MKAAGIGAIRKELAFLPPKELSTLCEQLVQFQKNNKELATYFLFYKHDEQSYRTDLKTWLDDEFEALIKNLYLMTKSIKKLSKMLAIRLKCSGNKQTETELLIHFLRRMEKALGEYSQFKSVETLFVSHIKKANKAMSKLNEEAKDMYFEELLEIAQKLHFNLKQIIG